MMKLYNCKTHAGSRKSSVVAGIFFLLLSLMITAGCAVNPYTERPQLILVPQGTENELGREAYEKVLSDPKIRISSDPEEVEPVRRVAERIIQAAKRSKYAETAGRFKWEVTVIKDDKTVNAFALPGGKIVVYTGILPVAQNDAGLAVVLGHEVTHALARHGAERISEAMVAQLVLTGTETALGMKGMDPQTSNSIMQALGLGAQIGILLPFSREHESEADHVGLILAAQAGYDPREAIRLWERMERSGGHELPEFLSTHPGHGTRIAQLRKWMPEALKYYNESQRQ